MIAWENLRGAAGGSGGEPTRRWAPDWPASAREPGNIVFVHGYNMEEGISGFNLIGLLFKRKEKILCKSP